ncbi:MAG: O-antigen ligase family protein, partial [Thermodesulfobacteriota bacterium]|nr:O-antigen ligase family protein [Thermodesulfobacteriota bacterium]
YHALLLMATVFIGGIIFLMPAQFINFYIFIKPIIDQGVEFLGTAGRHAAGVAFPMFTFIYALFTRKDFKPLSFRMLVALYILLYLTAFIRFGPYNMNALGLYLRALLPPLLYFSIPTIINQKKDVIKLIKFGGWSGLSASFVIFLQFLGLINPTSKQELLTVGEEEMLRYTGGYFDAFSASLPIIVSIICLLFVIQFQKKKLYFVILAINIFAVIMTVHRMSTIVLAVVFTVWVIVNKKIKLGLLALVVILFSLPFLMQFVPDFFGEVNPFAETESSSSYTANDEGLTLSSQALHGRGWLWRSYLERFNSASGLDQLIGVATTGRGPHNDYLRILMNLGFFGLMLHLLLLALIGLKLISIFRKSRRSQDEYLAQLSMTAFFFWIFLFLGSMTLAVGLLSTMMWYFWMFAGITFVQYRNQQVSATAVEANLTDKADRGRKE